MSPDRDEDLGRYSILTSMGAQARAVVRVGPLAAIDARAVHVGGDVWRQGG